MSHHDFLQIWFRDNYVDLIVLTDKALRLVKTINTPKIDE